MPAPAVTYTFAPNTLVKASEANTNFQDLVGFLTSEAIQKDASVAFTNIPSGPATDPTGDNQYARKAYVDSAPAQGILGIVSRETDAGPDNFAAAEPGTIIAGLTKAVTVPAGRRVRVKANCRGILGTVAGDVFAVRIIEGSTVLAESLVRIETTGNGTAVPTVETVLEPSTGAHTYSVCVKRLSGTGAATFYGAATYKFQLVIEDCGPVA